MIVEHYDRIKGVQVDPEQIMTGRTTGQSREISDELIDGVVKLPRMPVDDVNFFRLVGYTNER